MSIIIRFNHLRVDIMQHCQNIINFNAKFGFQRGFIGGQVGAFEQGLLSHMRGEGKDILAAIADKKAVTDEIKEKLVAAIDSFAKTFA